MSTRDLGSVTSYAMAVALGFEGTEAEWVTYMMEAGDNAASAAASAASASASATSAEASAETARINYGSPLAASTLSGMTEQNRVYVYTGVEQGMVYGDWYYYDGSGWVDGGVYNATAEGQGLTDNERALILSLFSKAAYAEDDAGDAYDQLSALWSVYSVTWSGTGYTHGNTSVSARGGSTFVSTVTADGGHTISTVVATMGGTTVQGAYNNGVVTIPNVLGDIVITVTTIEAEVSSISAVYTQSGTVYDTDSLDSLKSDLVVTVTYADQSTAVIPSTDYTLSGTLTEGTSTVTVTYGGKTTTFTVTVTALTVVGIVASGTPSVSDGILTPSSSGYFVTEEIFDPDDKPWKLRTKLYCTSRSGNYQDVICSYSLAGVAQRGLMVQGTTDYLSLYLSSNNTSWDIGSTSPNGMFSDGEWAWYEIEYDGTKYTISKSTDGETFTVKGTVSSATPLIGDFAIAFGAKRNANYFNGTIDLTETKIYLDGQLWAEYSAS